MFRSTCLPACWVSPDVLTPIPRGDPGADLWGERDTVRKGVALGGGPDAPTCLPSAPALPARVTLRKTRPLPRLHFLLCDTRAANTCLVSPERATLRFPPPANGKMCPET